MSMSRINISVRSCLVGHTADSLFTTHTPVPAGNDAFHFDLMDRFFGQFWGQLGIGREEFLVPWQV